MTLENRDEFDVDPDGELLRWLDRQGEAAGVSKMDAPELERLLELAREDDTLPLSVGERLQARLELARDLGTDLDSLLGSVPRDAAPAGLAQRALRRVRSEVALDALLDAVPLEGAPVGLGARVLAYVVEHERRARFRRLGALGMALAAGILLLFTLRSTGGNVAEPSEAMAGRDLTPADLELLQDLDLLEDWEDVTDPELLLDGLDPFESLLVGGLGETAEESR